MVEKMGVVWLKVVVQVFFQYCCTYICHVVYIPVVTAISGRSCNWCLVHPIRAQLPYHYTLQFTTYKDSIVLNTTAHSTLHTCVITL